MENFNNYIVNLSNLKNNFNEIKQCVGANVKVCAMVKADAYGHGLKDVCNVLVGADFFGVASVFEAKKIRKFNKFTNILVVGVSNWEHIIWCGCANVSVTVSSVSELNKIISILNGAKIKVHIKINTGLNRIGVNTISEFKQILRIIKDNNNIMLEGVFTHFATKLNDVEFMLKQYETFCSFTKFVDNQDVIIHCCNSFATLWFNKFHNGMVRCGFNLYGWQLASPLNLKPVLNITSKIVFIHKIKKGESVGYDRDFIADKNMVVAVLPIGYADGLDRRLSNNFSVLVNGEWAKIIGNICMDVCMVDITAINAAVGDDVVLLGNSGKLELTPHNYASVLGTSPYEILLKFKYDRMNRILIK